MQTRRRFLEKSGLLLLGTAASLAITEQACSASSPGQPAMIIDLNRCIGCQSCVIACKGYTKTAPGKFNTHVITEEKASVPARISFTPVQCNQCDNPPCVPACPFDATFKLANGIVVIDLAKCRSCGSCIDACPYGARFRDQNFENKADKCDFCNDRLQEGLEPACVEACSSHARIFGDMNAPKGEFATYLQDKKLAIRKPEKKTGPNILYVQSRRDQGELA